MIETQVAAGRLLRLRHGVYLAADSWPADARMQHLLRAHAEQVANPGAVLSHASAAVYWGLPSPSPQDWHASPVSVTFPAGQGHTARHGGTLHRCAVLSPRHVVEDEEGYSVTSIARTATDLSVGLTLPEALVILDAASRLLCAGYSVSPKRSTYADPHLARAAREELLDAKRPRGAVALRQAIDICDPRRESPVESLSTGHFVLAGLPTPEFQARLTTPMGTFYADFFWREYRLIGECDGAVKYADPTARVAEKHREQSLREEGYGFVRWLGGEIMTSPGMVVGRVARALER